MLLTNALGVHDPASPLAPLQIARRQPGPHDILFEILYCGICHTDVTVARGGFPNSIFPMVPGHEIVGKIVQVGADVTRHRIGELVGVGAIADSCRKCPECRSGYEQFCEEGMTSVCNAYERDGITPTYGGFSARMTIDENYAVRIPTGLPAAAAAPLLCGGITTYSPLRHWGVGQDTKLGVVGMGGLGHIAVKLAIAMGAEVTVFSSSSSKRADAKRLGAKDFIVADSRDALSHLSGNFDIILNTVSADIDYDAYIGLLRRDGTLVMLGLPDGPISISALGLMFKRRRVASSVIGGIGEMQEMLDFCAEHGVVPEIEMISITEVNEAFDRILSGDVRYRFVVDMAPLRAAP